LLIGHSAAYVQMLVRHRRFAAGQFGNLRLAGNGGLGFVGRAGVGTRPGGYQQGLCVTPHLTPMLHRTKAHATRQHHQGEAAAN